MNDLDRILDLLHTSGFPYPVQIATASDPELGACYEVDALHVPDDECIRVWRELNRRLFALHLDRAALASALDPVESAAWDKQAAKVAGYQPTSVDAVRQPGAACWPRRGDDPPRTQ
ncbi:MAG TPA: hypothetical protein VK348_03385 [Planctomycetota bacterium]|nr:hypothetical protein [Planctomycetota bacterium]